MSAGLTVRWSLAQAPADHAEQLRQYVTESSHARFEELPGLRFKTWRMREREWFEGVYVFVDDAARRSFAESFAPGADSSPVSELTGAGPILIEESEIVSVAIGPEGATSLPAGERTGV
jgi:hypothetical protein